MNVSKDKTGGPVFPLNELDQITGFICEQHFGITVRDYFAGQALAGDFAAGEDSLIYAAKSQEEAARYYYKMADAMLRARDL